MNKKPDNQLLRHTLWHVDSSGVNAEKRGTRYWWENHDRKPETCLFQITIGGAMVFRNHRGERLVEAGAAMITRHGEHTAYGLTKYCPGPYHAVWLCMNGEGLLPHWQMLTQLTGGVMQCAQPRLIEKHARELAMYSRQTALVDPISMARQVNEFVMRLLDEAYTQRLVKLSPVDGAIEKLLSQPCYPWSLKELADEAGVSREHMSRVFHEKMGQSPAKYLNEKRCARARLLLKQMQMPLTEIAEQSGFTQIHTFIRQMKSYLGVSPGRWRDEQNIS